ncbi:MAG: hypothetical protein N5P05_003519 [Chroococcopsis gigantea SAG 12.99]|nr:hypothetical protein [Chroococcopsis gigantea SAG 12.99]
MTHSILQKGSGRFFPLNALVKFILLFVLVFLVCISPSYFLPVHQVSNSGETRGVWITNVNSGVLYLPGGIDRSLRQLSQLQFNTVYPVVWNRGFTFYPSDLARQEIGKSQQPLLSWAHIGGDALQKITRRAHQHKMRVIPWFEYGLIVPASSELIQKHPDWVTRGFTGRTQISYEDELEATSDGSNSILRPRPIEQVWLNPFRPDVQKFLTGLILEVVKNYHIEGIQLDDHFGLPVQLGYDDWTIALYKLEHGGDFPPANIYDRDWMRWRAAKLTNFLARIRQEIKKVKPDVIISLSPNSYGFAYRHYLQDWTTWVQKGLVDEIVLQVYRDNLKKFGVELSQAAVKFAKKQVPVSVAILSGTWNRPIKIEQIEAQVKYTRQQKFKGVSFFYWETLWGYFTPESPRQRRQVFQTLFQRKEKVEA